MSKTDDAWKQHDDLIKKFYQEWEPRPDLRIEALACDRSVRFSLGEFNPAFKGERLSPISRYHWHSTQRNVSTMRELAEALLAACDFVEKSNPVWASKIP